MEQHPVPQQISSYSFKLVGDMTLKQFVELAGGALLAIIVYSTGLPGFIKWPMIIFFALSGAALAFLPLEERPLEEWVIAFFRSIYSPTVYLWRGRTDPDTYFQKETAQSPQTTQQQSLQTQSQIANNVPTEAETQLEDAEKAFLSKVTNLFHAPQQETSEDSIAVAASQNVEPAVSTTPPPPPVNLNDQPTTPVAQASNQAPSVPTIHTTTSTSSQPISANNQTISAVNPPGTDIQTNDIPPTPQSVRQNTIFAAPQQSSTDNSLNSQQNAFSDEVDPPMPVTRPNVIVGQVMDPEGKVIEGAILEIKDENGRPVRALRSNKSGHFMIVTPLPDGQYQLITEKEGFQFEPYSFSANGDIISPIPLRANKRLEENEQQTENTNI